MLSRLPSSTTAEKISHAEDAALELRARLELQPRTTSPQRQGLAPLALLLQLRDLVPEPNAIEGGKQSTNMCQNEIDSLLLL